MPSAKMSGRYDRQRALVEKLQAQLRFELLVLRRIEARERPNGVSAVNAVLDRARGRSFDTDD